MGVADLIAVVVQGGMELWESHHAVAAEDGPGDMAQVAAPERAGRRTGRGKGTIAEGGWASAMADRVYRPQAVSEVVGLTQGFETLIG